MRPGRLSLGTGLSSSMPLTPAACLLGVSMAPAVALTLLLAVALSALSMAQPCLKTAAPPNVVVARPDGNATLPCLDDGQLDNATEAYWTFEGRNVTSTLAGPAAPGRVLFLPRVHLNHSGSYTCHVGGHPSRTWRLAVEEPPEAPDFSCRQRSLNNEIICEWRAARTTSLRTKAKLWVQKGFFSQERVPHPCRYYAKSQKFSCRTQGLKEKEDLKLRLSVCLATLAGAATRHKFFNTETLLKPDPPDNVTVSAVEGCPRQLRVSWSYPRSWGPTFYRLGFQLRYRPQGAHNYSQVCLPHASSYVISDALKGRAHAVQLRCREQFNHGEWSEWSHEDVATPWTEPKDLELETVTNASKAPSGDPLVSLVSLETPREVGDPSVKRSMAPLPGWTLLVVTVIAAVVLALVVLLLVAFRWRKRPSNERKPSYALAPFATAGAPECPLSASPLLPPSPQPQFCESPADGPPGPGQGGPFDVANAHYFLLAK